jgi:hypothetical protein
MKLGLYSITYLGIWYRGKALTLPELIKKAKRLGYDGVEIDGKRPHDNPLDWPTWRWTPSWKKGPQVVPRSDHQHGRPEMLPEAPPGHPGVNGKKGGACSQIPCSLANRRRSVLIGREGEPPLERHKTFPAASGWIRNTGGGYFFSPSITALREVLARDYME